MPTPIHSKQSTFKIADSGSTLRDFSAVDASTELDRALDKTDVSGFGASYKSYVVGLADATITYSGWYDRTTLGYLEGILGVNTTFEYDPEGSGATGSVKYTGTLFIDDFKVTSAITAAVQVSLTFQIVGTVTVGTN